MVSFFFLFLLSFIFAYSQRSQMGWCGLSANLECMSEMCCTRLAENTGRKNYAKYRHIRTIAQLCRAISSQLRYVSTIRKKLLYSNISFTCPRNMVNLGPLTAEIDWRVWGTQQISRLGLVTASTSLNGDRPNFTRCLAVFWAGTLYTLFFGGGGSCP